MLLIKCSIIVARMSNGVHLAHTHLLIVWCSARMRRGFAKAKATALTGISVHDFWPVNGSLATSLLLLGRHWRVILLSVDV